VKRMAAGAGHTLDSRLDTSPDISLDTKGRERSQPDVFVMCQILPESGPWN